MTRVLDWVREVHRHTIFTTSVCTGSLVLAAAGLLSGLTAATHWRGVELLESFGAVYTPQRVVEHLPERIITAAGVSSGIDMALRLLELLVDRGGGAGRPADDRVRPAAAVRHGVLGQGRRGGPGAGAGLLPAAQLNWGEQTQNRTIRGRKGDLRLTTHHTGPAQLISLIRPCSCSLGRLPTQATLPPRTDRGRKDHRR